MIISARKQPKKSMNSIYLVNVLFNLSGNLYGLTLIVGASIGTALASKSYVLIWHSIHKKKKTWNQIFKVTRSHA